MKIINKFLIIGIIIGIISGISTTVLALHIYNANEINYKNNERVKNALDRLDVDLNNYRNDYLGILKRKGINISDNADLVQVKNGIKSLGAADVKFLGNGTSFDIKTLVPTVDYKTLSTSNFIVGGKSISALSATGKVKERDHVSGRFDPYNLSVSYNNQTGILSVSGTSYGFYGCGDDGYYYCKDMQAYANVNVYAYLVLGELK